MYYPRRKPPPPPKPPERVPAISEVMKSEFQNRPFGGRGGVVGEFIVGSREPAAPPQVIPPLIPPPPWAVNYDPALDPDHEPPLKPETSDEEEER
jgi:hypothetical protein